MNLTDIITATDPPTRNRSLDAFCASASTEDLLNQCAELERFRVANPNLYERVRACFFLYAIHRFHLPTKPGFSQQGRIPFVGYEHLLERRFEEAIADFLRAQSEQGPSDALSSALASAYHRRGFQILADQVRSSVRAVRGNQWMFRVGHPHDQPLRVREELKARSGDSSLYPVLKEATPVRMDLTHSAWSDIFFLGMDYPEGARVLNVSIDLAVLPREGEEKGIEGNEGGIKEDSDESAPFITHYSSLITPKPPVEAYFRVIDEPVLRLGSVDLGVSSDITSLGEVFDFARDYLGLLKAALIASGIVPPGIEGSGQSLADLLTQVVGPGQGIELVSNVNGIPKGSRLAVSTNLLAALITACMRATRQTRCLEGTLEEDERRLVAARAILGEWLAGSGGGWQDSGGVWPGIKLIQGQAAQPGDPEAGISRGRLLPTHRIFTHQDASEETRQKLQDSLVLVHGGLAQNVGPILEMVTEKYLLRSEAEWQARQDTGQILDSIVSDLQSGDVRALAEATTRNFFGPLQTIIPAASNLYTETLIIEIQERFGADFWGFWMLGGMSGGGMGFIFAPERKREAQIALQEIMSANRRKFEHALPFAMEPVVYDFAINPHGTRAELLQNENALLPSGYYVMTVPALVRQDPRDLPSSRRAELDTFAQACRTHPELGGMVQKLFDRLLPRAISGGARHESLHSLLTINGFDPVQHESIRQDLRAGRIGLAQNRLPVNADIRDVEPGDIADAQNGLSDELREQGLQALRDGRVAVVSLAAGVGSRWTQGAGVVKALHPFAKLDGKFRTFLEVHLAKSRCVGEQAGTALPHVFTTSYLTHGPIAEYLQSENNYDYPGPLLLSHGLAIGLRMVPTVRDLRFAWEEMPQQRLDAQAQKMRESGRAALIGWAQSMGEASDYTDNLPGQCLHPVGHWYEVPSLIRNGMLARLLAERPNLQTLMIHNIDTLGADADPVVLGLHLRENRGLSVEVVPRRLEDRGGGLARVNGKVRLIEGLAMPREEAEFNLTYYNSLTTWVDVDALLGWFGLTRETIHDEAKVTAGIRALAARIPTYITLKDVKKRWGQGQEDVFPVAQFEKLWGDMTALPELNPLFIAVSRQRGQQLKEQAQLDGWQRDGSASYVASLCHWR